MGLSLGRTPPSVPVVVERTVDLIAHAEAERARLGLPKVAYEVGTEEVHGGLVDIDNFTLFLDLLKQRLDEHGLASAWPTFVVAQVGTDLHTTYFDPAAAQRLTAIVRPTGALLKGHYTDWVENPADYAATGMGGANVGPEFTAVEYDALEELDARDARLCANRRMAPADFMRVLEQAVVDSNRWQKWLQPDEQGRDFADLDPARRRWLAQTGARYVWTAPPVLAARRLLYAHLSTVSADPHAYVVESVARSIEHYVDAFGLYDAVTVLA